MKISVVVTLSKPECIDLVKENIRVIKEDITPMEIIVMVDNSRIGDSVKDLGTVHRTRRNEPPKHNMPYRRNRITMVKNESKDLIGDSDLVFSFEDDTALPKGTLKRLLKDWETLKTSKVGFISGLQAGRHGKKHLGAWYGKGLQFPTEITSLDPKSVATSLAQVDAAGFYCYITPTRLYKQADYGWNEPVGPDVWYGFWLRLQGYNNYVDQRIKCGHLSGDKMIDCDDVEPIRIHQQKGKWVFGKPEK